MQSLHFWHGQLLIKKEYEWKSGKLLKYIPGDQGQNDLFGGSIHVRFQCRFRNESHAGAVRLGPATHDKQLVIFSHDLGMDPVQAQSSVIEFHGLDLRIHCSLVRQAKKLKRLSDLVVDGVRDL